MNTSNFFDLAPDEEVVTVLGKPMGRIILEYDFSLVTKYGFGVQPAEAEAMRLISNYTSVPAPEVYHTDSAQRTMALSRCLSSRDLHWKAYGIHSMKKPRNLFVAKPGISSLKSSPSRLNMRAYSNALQMVLPQETHY